MKSIIAIAVTILCFSLSASSFASGKCRVEAENTAMSATDDSSFYRVVQSWKLKNENSAEVIYDVSLGEVDDQDGKDFVVETFRVILDSKDCHLKSVK